MQLATRISNGILESELDCGHNVAILADKTISTYAGVLGILRSGKAWLPLNGRAPIRRNRQVLAMANCRLIIVSRDHVDYVARLLEGQDPITILADGWDVMQISELLPMHRWAAVDDTSSTGTAALDRQVTSPHRTAYLMFTSGSTGRPKGVPVAHQNVLAYLRFVSRAYGINETDRFTQVSTVAFDLSVHDMFACWANGACLIPVPEDSLFGIADRVKSLGPTMWLSVPTVASLMSKLRILNPGVFNSLRCSLFCGEPLSVDTATKWQTAAPNSVIENLYGPTETTIAVTRYRWGGYDSHCESDGEAVPIGRVFDDHRYFVADEYGEDVDLGHTGELWLSGPQVTEGYSAGESASQGNFVIRQEGFESTMWYRTGDLVKENTAGCLTFVGRMDDQVKIRGHRVELQEVDHVLRNAAGTELAYAVAWPRTEEGAAGIVGFIAGESSVDAEQITKECRQVLPEYMVPHHIHLIDEIPLTPNGKVDRSKLTLRLN